MKRSFSRLSPYDEEYKSHVRRRIIVRTACHYCRRQKKRCDGLRPVCGNCTAQGNVECTWDTQDEKETRTAALRRENTELKDSVALLQKELDRVNEERQAYAALESGHHVRLAHANNLLQTLSTVSDVQSTSLLALMRSGSAWREVAKDLFDGGAAGLALLPVLMRPDESDAGLNLLAAPWVPRLFNRRDWADPDSKEGESVSSISKFDPETSNARGNTPGSGLKKSFGNLPFSASICANGYPSDVQNFQYQNMVVPAWAMRPLINTHQPDPFEAILRVLRKHIDDGVSLELICGEHVYLDALGDENTFRRAPLLSQYAAGLVKSIKPNETTTFTQYAIMWAYWTFLRWLLAPTAQTYEAIPTVLRPVPQQLFCLHSRTFDFILSPIMRVHMCMNVTPDDRWITAGYTTLASKGPIGKSPGWCLNEGSGEVDISVLGKAFAADPGSWSVGPSIRPFLQHAEMYWRIREQDDAHESPLTVGD